jgi:hypothetical protein
MLITSILEQALKAGMYFWRAVGWPLTGFSWWWPGEVKAVHWPLRLAEPPQFGAAGAVFLS